MKTTPYNTGKVKIGCNYTPPQRVYEPSRTEVMLQDALLAKRYGKTGIDWDGIWIVVITGALIALPLVILAVKS